MIILFASSSGIFHTRGERATVVAVIYVVIVDITVDDGDALDVVSLQARRTLTLTLTVKSWSTRFGSDANNLLTLFRDSQKNASKRNVK